MDYVVCESESLEQLQRKVNEYRKLDYAVTGGIAVVRERISGPLRYFQAVVRNHSDPPLRTMIVRRRGRPPIK